MYWNKFHGSVSICAVQTQFEQRTMPTCQLQLNRYIDIDVSIFAAINCDFRSIEMQMRAIETNPHIIIGSMVAVLLRSLSEVLSFFIFSILLCSTSSIISINRFRFFFSLIFHCR